MDPEPLREVHVINNTTERLLPANPYDCSSEYTYINDENNSGVVDANRNNSAFSRILTRCRKRSFVAIIARFLEAILFISAMLGFDWVFENPLCNVYFRCGCDWNWKGGFSRCNIHDPNAPHCPWCASRGSGSWLTRIYLFAIALYIALQQKHLTIRWIVPFIAYFPISFVIAAGFKLNAPEYPYFLTK